MITVISEHRQRSSSKDLHTELNAIYQNCLDEDQGESYCLANNSSTTTPKFIRQVTGVEVQLDETTIRIINERQERGEPLPIYQGDESHRSATPADGTKTGHGQGLQ